MNDLQQPLLHIILFIHFIHQIHHMKGVHNAAYIIRIG